ncbi:MAG: hypothetical protein DMG41_24150 [Acidobacteria bacterium]|nr:MAG: hypothetical protein AUH01_02070 [Acidobacteria bacterium 13_2_20CM_56_17]PYT76532.1 MAG: hypothetical protein DMG42_04940 [Acidobacteriota bacterium]PYT85290.1 MAG: hypothetical protein DMG41_24150 [Acidobacteriota bacterium]
MRNTGTLQVTMKSDREVVLKRIFDAPRRMVFEAMTKPELLKRWMGPRGWELVVSEIELRVGGKWRSVLRSPEGKVLEKFLKRPPLFVCLIQQALTHGSPDVSFAHSVASR